MGAFTFALSDTISLSEQPKTQRGVLVADQIPFQDGFNLIALGFAVGRFQEQLLISDLATVNLQAFAIVNFNFLLADTFSFLDRNDQHTIRPTDTLSFTDFVDFDTVRPGFEVQDNIIFTDSIIGLNTWKTNPTDALALSDVTVQQRNWVLPFSDTNSLSDSAGVFNQFPPSDAVSFSDVAAYSLAALPVIQVFQNGQDQLLFADSVQYVKRGSLVSAGDQIPFNDSAMAILNSTPNAYLRRYLNDVL